TDGRCNQEIALNQHLQIESYNNQTWKIRTT
ncbi:uncharacterized protein METZ01_LOCUS465343, partial [marine metagenome]